MKKLLATSLLCFLACVSVNCAIRAFYPYALRDDVKYAPDSRLVSYLSFGHRSLAADILFVDVVLHCGSLVWKPYSVSLQSEWSYKMIDVATELDPKFFTAYLFAAMGLVHDVEDVMLARPILEKGMKEFPGSWELPFWLGYDFLIYREDFDTAAGYLWQASQKPAAPKSFLALALKALRASGSYEKALLILKAMMDETADESTRTIFLKKIRQLEDLIFLQEAARRYHEQTGEYPADLQALVAARVIEELPVDPMGMRYEWDWAKKRVQVR